jgi:hypothetical protein
VTLTTPVEQELIDKIEDFLKEVGSTSLTDSAKVVDFCLDLRGLVAAQEEADG